MIQFDLLQSLTVSYRPEPQEEAMPADKMWTVVDLFSCGGGASAGFSRRRKEFRLCAAVDLEQAKPSGGNGSSDCNLTYATNNWITPLNRDLMELDPGEFAELVGIIPKEIDVLISCPPCTDLSRAKPINHLTDSAKNSLIGRSADYVIHLLPAIVFMENARELIMGRFAHHHREFCRRLREHGYDVRSDVHLLSRFGLPQVRERSLVVASRIGPARTLEDLWAGHSINADALTVRTALKRLAKWRTEHPIDLEGDVYPGMTPAVRKRLAATPRDGGGWVDVARNPKTRSLCTPDCLRRWKQRDFGSHPDVYGRMWWDRPAPTIKRECAHVGNGRYAHPVEDRLLTVREMATLQGFPFDYRFPARAISNRYRHIGDAVPPVVSYQLSSLAAWMITGRRPEPAEWVMPDAVLRIEDILSIRQNSAQTQAAA